MCVCAGVWVSAKGQTANEICDKVDAINKRVKFLKLISKTVRVHWWVCVSVCVCGLGVYRQSFPAGTHQSFIAFAEGLVTSSLVNKMAAVAFPLSCKMAYGARLKVPLTAVACNCLPVCDMTSQLAKHECVCIYMWVCICVCGCVWSICLLCSKFR